MSSAIPTPPEVTLDTLLRGRVKLWQPARGFRSSLDPVLLAGFVAPPFGRFLDIGCGTGAVAFLLLAQDPAARGTGVEIQPRLAELCRRSIGENGFAGRLALEQGDVRRRSLPAASFDLVVSNPPFQPLGQGDLPPDQERSIAHHEVSLALVEWLAVAARAVRPEGRVAAVFAAARASELLTGLSARGLTPARLRAVHPRPGAAATRVLVEACRQPGPRPLTIESPLFVHEGSGYSPELKRWLGEEEQA